MKEKLSRNILSLANLHDKKIATGFNCKKRGYNKGIWFCTNS